MLCHVSDVLNVSLGQVRLLLLFKQALDSSRHDLSLENAVGNTILSLALAPENSVNLHSVARLCLIDKVILQHDLNRPGQLAGRRTLRHLLDGDDLSIFVNTVPILSSERVLVLILDWELCVVLVMALSVLSQLRQVGVISVVLNHALLGHFTVMDRSLDLGSDNSHAGHDALHGDHLVDKVGLQATRRDVV